MIKSYPIVHFEISGKCNGKCPYCSTGNKNQPLGNFVDIDIFDKTLDKIIQYGIFDLDISTLYIYNWGEPLLHPQFNKIIEIINSKKIKYSISSNISVIPNDLNYTNLVDNLEKFMISISGFSQKSYDKIHGFNFEKIKDNIISIKENLDRYNFKGKIQLLFHVYQFNVDEIVLAERFSKELGIEFIPYYAGINDWWKRKQYLENSMTKSEIKKISNDLFLSKLDERIESSSRRGCSQHNSYFMIDERGNVATCCCLPTNHPNYKCGNIMQDDINKILHNKSNMEICRECINDGLAIEDNQVCNPKWYEEISRNNRMTMKYKLEMDKLFKEFGEGKIDPSILMINIISRMATDYLLEDDLIEMFYNNTFYEINQLIILVSKLYERGLYRFAIEVLKYSLKLKEYDEDILFNLGYISFELGRYNDSISYLKRIENQDSEIEYLINKCLENIRGI